MLISCRNLPPPVAKCCLPKQDGHLKVNIYIEDPEFRVSDELIFVLIYHALFADVRF